MPESGQPSSTVNRPLWVIAFALVTIAFCLIALVASRQIVSEPVAESQSAPPVNEDPGAEPTPQPKPKLAIPVPRTLHSTVIAQPSPPAEDNQPVTPIVNADLATPEPIQPASAPIPTGGFVPQNGSGRVAASSALAGFITVKGSDTLVVLAQKWAEAYMGKRPQVRIQVIGGGSGVGFAALQNQTVDIADASRPIKPTEIAGSIKAFGKKPTEYVVAIDGLSVFVNEANPVKELTLDQLAGIFSGTIRNWREVGGSGSPITVYSRENSSGTYEFFKEHVLKGKDFAGSAQTKQGAALLVRSISKDKNGIGYGGAGDTRGIRALGVKVNAISPAVVPSEKTVLNQTYPIWRYLYNYVNAAADKDEIHAYLTWIRGAEGQKIVKEANFYPLLADLQSKELRTESQEVTQARR